MATRELILEAATRAIVEVGYAAFTMTAIGKELGISSGSLFHAFPSKPALAAAVYVEGMAEYQRVATEAIDAARGPRRAVRAWVATHLAWIEEHRALARFLFSTLPPEVRSAAAGPLAGHNRRFFAALDALFLRAQQQGLMGNLAGDVATSLVIGPAQDYGRKWTRGSATVPPTRLTRLMQDAAVAALAGSLPPPRRRKEKTR